MFFFASSYLMISELMGTERKAIGTYESSIILYKNEYLYSLLPWGKPCFE